MTCKCGAQFCYTCGAKWRTCRCTGFDETDRQVELRRLRAERQTMLDDETAEMAQIIAEIEATERREGQERQRREEAELARLEEQRLQEEAARREEELQLERDFQQALRSSIEHACNELQLVLDDITAIQRKELDTRHSQAEQLHSQEYTAESAECEKECQDVLDRMESNINKRTTSIESKQRTNLEAFTAEQEELEDDLFLQIRIHLRGKNDHQAREQLLQDRFQKQQEERYGELLTRHQSESEVLKVIVSMERDILKRTHDGKMAQLEQSYLRKLDTLLLSVAAERAWFHLILERRRNMVLAHTRLMLEAVDAGDEPIGLTEEAAMTIGPFIADGGLNSKTRTFDNSVTGGMAELQQEYLGSSPTTSKRYSSSEVHLNRVSVAGPSDPPMMNTAWEWMIGSSNGQFAPSRAERSHRALRRPLAAQRSEGLYQDPMEMCSTFDAGHLGPSGVHHPWRQSQGAIPACLQVSRPGNEPHPRRMRIPDPSSRRPVSGISATDLDRPHELEDNQSPIRTPGTRRVSTIHARLDTDDALQSVRSHHRHAHKRHSSSASSESMTLPNSASSHSTARSSIDSFPSPGPKVPDSTRQQQSSPAPDASAAHALAVPLKPLRQDVAS